MHGGGPAVKPGIPLHKAYTEEHLEFVSQGVVNMQRHIQNSLKFGVPVVVAINAMTSDSPAEIKCVRDAALEAGAFDAVLSTHW
jgi:methylenetetrahydrofolate dehydrogenase (NADP+)/methenyltetrahydrofolate cyclohydrolase/formyltetrahydrofolate synthetase